MREPKTQKTLENQKTQGQNHRYTVIFAAIVNCRKRKVRKIASPSASPSKSPCNVISSGKTEVNLGWGPSSQ